MNKAKLPYRLFVTILTVVTTLGACNQIEKTASKATVTSEFVDKGVRLRISSDKATYQPSETVNITVSVENLTNTPIEYTLWNIGDPSISVYLDNTPYSTGQTLFEKDYKVKEVLPAVTSDVLQSRKSILRQVVWNQQLNTYPDSIQAPTGPYTIRCEFFVGPYFSEKEPTKLSASIQIQIQTAWQIIKPEEAIKIASSVPEVASWYVEHSGPNLIKYENGQYYLFFFSEWQKVSPDFTIDGMTLDELKQKYKPDNNVLMISNNWEVHFFTKFGSIPNEIIVRIEPTTGKVLSFEVVK